MQKTSPLRLQRLALGLRLHDVEAATGLADTTVSRLERGETTLNGPRLHRLAAFYGVSPSVLAAAMGAWRTSRGGGAARAVESEAPKLPNATP